MGTSQRRRRDRRARGHRLIGRFTGRPPTLEEARDAVMSDHMQDIVQDRAQRRRQMAYDLGFSWTTVFGHPEMVEAYLQDLSRLYHGVDPRVGTKKAGRKRQRPRRRSGRWYPLEAD